jgi:hypothetical protein
MSEELTTWESVGLDTAEPPPLLSLYRYGDDCNEEVTFYFSEQYVFLT